MEWFNWIVKNHQKLFNKSNWRVVPILFKIVKLLVMGSDSNVLFTTETGTSL